MVSCRQIKQNLYCLNSITSRLVRMLWCSGRNKKSHRHRNHYRSASILISIWGAISASRVRESMRCYLEAYRFFQCEVVCQTRVELFKFPREPIKHTGKNWRSNGDLSHSMGLSTIQH